MSDTVQRYKPSDWTDGNGGSAMRLSATGPYVLHEDYAKLETELRDTRHERIVLISAMRQAYGLIENGMEIRAKQLLGHALDLNKKARKERLSNG